MDTNEGSGSLLEGTPNPMRSDLSRASSLTEVDLSGNDIGGYLKENGGFCSKKELEPTPQGPVAIANALAFASLCSPSLQIFLHRSRPLNDWLGQLPAFTLH